MGSQNESPREAGGCEAPPAEEVRVYRGEPPNVNKVWAQGAEPHRRVRHKSGIAPVAWTVEDDHDSSSIEAAFNVSSSGGIPMGLIYENSARPTFDQQIDNLGKKTESRNVEELISAYSISDS